MRNITGTLLTATGDEAPGVKISFALVDINTKPTSSFIATTGERVYGIFTATTDENGAFTIGLVENTLLVDETYYYVRTDMTGDVPFLAPLGEGLDDIDWLDFKANGGTVDPATYQLLEDYVTAAANSAADALESKNAADDDAEQTALDRIATGNYKTAAENAAASAEASESGAVLAKEQAVTAKDSAASSAGTAQQAAAELANYTSMTSLERALPTKAEFEAMAEERKRNRAGSGFDEWGKHLLGQSIINEGMWVWSNEYNAVPNAFRLGRNIDAIGTSRSYYPISSVNGVLQSIKDVGMVDDDVNNTIELPAAPTVTHADSSNSGMVRNGRNMVDTSEWVNAYPANCTLTAEDGRLKLVTTENSQIYQEFTGLIIGQKYTIEFRGWGYSNPYMSTNTLANGNIANFDYYTRTGKREVYEFTATATTLYFLFYGLGAGTTYVGDIFMCPSSEISRSDLVFLESWHEDISEKDIVYPLGNVQYRGYDTDGLTGIASGAFSGKETYSLFGNWQAANALVGKGYVWSTMSEADKIAFVSNPENNCYIDGDKVIQVRYRMRVIQGLGDEWENVSAQNYLLSMRYNTTNRVAVKGKYPSITNDLDISSIDHYYDQSNNDNIYQGIGHFSGYKNTAYDKAYEGKCYALPIALVHRRNHGGYHPKFNPNGTKPFWRNDGTANEHRFYYYLSKKPQSIANCFDLGDAANSGNVGPFVNSNHKRGTIELGDDYWSLGRIDGLFYDQVHESDILDLRNSSEQIQDFDRLGMREFNKAVAGTIRGEEGEWEIKKLDTWLSDGVQTTKYYFLSKRPIINSVLPNPIPYAAGNKYIADYGFRYMFAVRTSDNSVFNVNQLFIYNDTFYVDTGVTVTENDTFDIYVAQQTTRKKSNTLTHCDIIGDPANYYRGQDFIDSGSHDVAIGNVVWAKTATGGGTAGNFYEAVTAQTGIDLAAEDYSVTANWTDLGADWDGAGSWRTGVSGTPLLVGENGEDYATPTDNMTIKLSKKMLVPKFLLISDDCGATWFTGSLLSGFDETANTRIVNTLSHTNYVAFYTTHTNMAEPSVNSEVVALGDVSGISGFTDTSGVHLVSALINKVGTNDIAPLVINGIKLSVRFHLPDNLIHDNVSYRPTHTSILLGGTSPAIKVFPYITRENGRAYMQLVFKEIKYDDVAVAWGDDSKFDIVDNVSTTTDDNGNTVLIGQKRIALPYFIGDAE